MRKIERLEAENKIFKNALLEIANYKTDLTAVEKFCTAHNRQPSDFYPFTIGVFEYIAKNAIDKAKRI